MIHTQMTQSLRTLIAMLMLAGLTATTLHAGDGNAARGSHPVSAPGPQRLPGTLIMKLKPAVANRRGAVRFNLTSLDAVLDMLGASERRPLFPLSQYPEITAFGVTTDAG